ncbi:hypothetical protein BDN72DRAFT_105336 [Pluteus cervinus]|uniref:Uncharacterized protein n=1 Tax=Pluteus cervinus TaxID=181527 RepID=A0ACD3AN44_9AGAR|nr:hypothetical protein BDN72DRAFT_105336 [Pluteus cervinus]
MFTPPPSPTPPPSQFKGKTFATYPLVPSTSSSSANLFAPEPEWHTEQGDTTIVGAHAHKPRYEHQDVDVDEDLLQQHHEEQDKSTALKRRIGRNTRWLAIFVPLILVLVTLSTRYFSHPAVFDVLSGEVRGGKGKELPFSWEIHKRHPQAGALAADDDNLNNGGGSVTATAVSLLSASGISTAPQSPGSSTSQPALATVAATAQPLPTVPNNPPLPTPFPQPFDSSLSQNFSSSSCFAFFNNMTTAAPFRTCRPFSLLLQSSNQFLGAQQNLTLLNNIVWGTCNTSSGKSQCIANMQWFASSLQTQCSKDLGDRNTLAVDTLTALQAYEVMYNTGCLTDPTTSSYCFVNAVHSSSPSDFYYYQLPLGISVPKKTIPSCSACTRSVLSVYAAALQNGSSSDQLDQLKDTYNDAASAAVQACGADYAQSNLVNGAGPTLAVAFGLGKFGLGGLSQTTTMSLVMSLGLLGWTVNGVLDLVSGASMML